MLLSYITIIISVVRHLLPNSIVMIIKPDVFVILPAMTATLSRRRKSLTTACVAARLLRPPLFHVGHRWHHQGITSQPTATTSPQPSPTQTSKLCTKFYCAGKSPQNDPKRTPQDKKARGLC
jgi:hypothetical protein